jgi:hypothetical protein
LGINRRGFEKRVAARDRVLVDTSVPIAYVDPSDATRAVAVLLIDDFMRSGRNAAIVSPVTAMEILARPTGVSDCRAGLVCAKRMALPRDIITASVPLHHQPLG